MGQGSILYLSFIKISNSAIASRNTSARMTDHQGDPQTIFLGKRHSVVGIIKRLSCALTLCLQYIPETITNIP